MQMSIMVGGTVERIRFSLFVPDKKNLVAKTAITNKEAIQRTMTVFFLNSKFRIRPQFKYLNTRTRWVRFSCWPLNQIICFCCVLVFSCDGFGRFIYVGKRRSYSEHGWMQDSSTHITHMQHCCETHPFSNVFVGRKLLLYTVSCAYPTNGLAMLNGGVIWLVWISAYIRSSVFGCS